MASDRETQFLRLLDAHGPALRRLTAGYERDPGHRQDLEQEIHLALWQALPTFAGQCSERTFVFRVAHNRAISHVRHWRLRKSEPLSDTVDPTAEGADPEQHVADRERSRALSDAVRALPLGHRQVILLLLEGATHREIAEVLGISEGNVAVRATRARRALSGALNAREHG